jgi:hypothetical protein
LELHWHSKSINLEYKPGIKFGSEAGKTQFPAKLKQLTSFLKEFKKQHINQLI